MDGAEGKGAWSSLQETMAALDEIDRLLHQMLLLAELSAGDSDVDRASLQKVLDHLRHKIDHIADRSGPI